MPVKILLISWGYKNPINFAGCVFLGYGKDRIRLLL